MSEPLKPKGLRTVSSVGDAFPIKGHVSYVLVADGTISNPHYAADRRAAARALRDGGAQLFAVWVGQYRSDLFEVDDIEGFLAAYPP